MSPATKLWPPESSGGGDAATAVINLPSQDLSDAPASPADGDGLEVRIGTYPNIHIEKFRWNALANDWVQPEKILITQADSSAMDLGNRSGTVLLDYSMVCNPIPYQRCYSMLSGSVNFSSTPSTLNVEDTDSYGHGLPFPTSGVWHCRDNVGTYTGKTGTTLTGVTKLGGSGGTVPAGIFVVAGYPGGWGFTSRRLFYADDLWEAGFRLQEKLISKLNSAPNPGSTTGGKKITIAPYWRGYDNGDGSTRPPITDSNQLVLPTGGIGMSAPLVGTDQTGGADITGERTFYLTENDWSDWAAGVPVKRYLEAEIHGKMEAGATDTGHVHNTVLAARWRG